MMDGRFEQQSFESEREKFIFCTGIESSHPTITGRDRYHLPVMHTETNLRDAKKAPTWLRKQWENMIRLREDGVPIIGFTWYSLIDQIDWDTALRGDNGRVSPLGLYDLNRQIRPVGKAYKKLIEQWRKLLPTESRSLDINQSFTT